MPSSWRQTAVSGYPANPWTQYMAIANTAASLRPAALAASIIVVAATMPPVRGGSPATTKLRSMSRGQ
ncbi:helix-turn-helix domain-containing protein, partial [Dysosmobacter welbionis]